MTNAMKLYHVFKNKKTQEIDYLHTNDIKEVEARGKFIYSTMFITTALDLTRKIPIYGIEKCLNQLNWAKCTDY